MSTSFGSQVAMSALVGRERELVALRGALDAALAGQGRLVLLSGAAGIGKTALVDMALAEAAGRGALVLVGRAYDLSETPPYGPWIEIFTHCPVALDHCELPVPLGTGAAVNRTILAEKAQAALVALAGSRPLAVFLDDLHWADPASLELLRFVARRLATLPILLLAAYRADEVNRHHPLYNRLPLLTHEADPLRLDLRPLADTAVRTLLGGRYALADDDAHRLLTYLGTHAEGNPLYTGELLRMLEEEGSLQRTGDTWTVDDLTTAQVPPLLRQVIEGRVARLGDEARKILTVAAAIGQEVPFGLWAAVTGADDERLFDVAERAIEVGILAEGTGIATVRFTHALIREALYEGIGALRRHALHCRVAEALLAAPHPDPDAVAYHFGRAGDERAFEWLLRAGIRARHADAWLTAIDRFTAAANL
ncbi:MAG TPA: AAA family ATPase, partial [Thermomicrobiales bacterium]